MQIAMKTKAVAGEFVGRPVVGSRVGVVEEPEGAGETDITKRLFLNDLIESAPSS
jgi:hypothetical protein